MPLYNKSRARRSVMDTVRYRIISQVATLSSYVVLVRGMSEHEFGVLSLLYALIPILSTMASFGVEQVLRRFEPEYLRAGKLDAAAWLVRTVASIRFCSNVVLLGLIAALWNFIAPLFQLAPYRLEYIYFCPLLMMHFQANILQLTLSSHLMQRYAIGMTAAQSTAKLIFYVVCLWMGSLTLHLAIIADTIGYGILYAGTRFAYVRYCRPPAVEKGFKLAAAERKRLLRYGFYNNFNDAGTLMLSGKSDNFFIAAYLSPVAVGAYSFYSRLNGMLINLLPLRQFSNVIRPFFFSVPPEKAAERLPRYFTLLVNLTLCVQLPIAAYAISYHSEIVKVLFGGKFIQHSGLLAVVVAFSIVDVMSEPATLVAQYAEKAATVLLSKLFLVYNVIALLALVPAFGLYGAAVATGSASMMKNLFIWWHVRDKARWKNFGGVVGSVVAVWGGAIALCYAVKFAVPAPAVAHLIFGGVVCAGAALIYVRSPGIAISDRRLLSEVMHGRELKILRFLGVTLPHGGKSEAA